MESSIPASHSVLVPLSMDDAEKRVKDKLARLRKMFEEGIDISSQIHLVKELLMYILITTEDEWVSDCNAELESLAKISKHQEQGLSEEKEVHETAMDVEPPHGEDLLLSAEVKLRSFPHEKEQLSHSGYRHDGDIVSKSVEPAGEKRVRGDDHMDPQTTLHGHHDTRAPVGDSSASLAEERHMDREHSCPHHKTRKCKDTLHEHDSVNVGQVPFREELMKLEKRIRADNVPEDHPFFHITWNASEWSEFFREISALLSKGELADPHPARVAVMIHTLGCCRQGFYHLPSPPEEGRYRKVVIDHSLIRTSQYKDIVPCTSACRLLCKQTSVSVACDDCIDVGRSMQLRGLNPLVLNMASATRAGGGFLRGDGAQEESLFRRSNYYISLSKFDGRGGRDVKYPIDEFGCIHSSGVTVFKSNESNGYELLSEPFEMSFVAAAALPRPPLTKRGHFYDEDACVVRHKIEGIFRAGVHHQHDSLVLSAFGCGAFRNPPEQVCEIFKSVMVEFNGYFKEIIFAIINDHNSKSMTKEGNFNVFERMLRDFEPQHEGSIILIEPHSHPCRYGGLCRLIGDRAHCKKYHHPSMCCEGAECKEKDDNHIHSLMFSHEAFSADGRVPSGNELM
eukprot:TRINITY_DN3707_c0_g1_i1.p1 TRINITY_DN3707_c0_g1~~TRINITY_DN3707_c0_g1_i1.p1  ORF type:complete len:623 (+),score=158.88 TRINITY_DN3707_c0_g1_i1:250-2118(+)